MDVVFTALLVPFALALLAVVLALRAAQAGRDGAAGRIGAWTTAVGVAGFVVCAVATVATGDPASTGPLYPLAMIVTLAGLVLAAVGSARAKVLSWWVVPLITLGWIFGGPVAESSGGPNGEGSPFGFPGASFILAAVYVVAAARYAMYRLVAGTRSAPGGR
ncbi:hypothetical protein [Pseudonocardia oroxyli]|uniref:hypothetical protein n=1 Tax=Pseudonocardia oroxyli TaxID=366584 RepID=UPI0015A1BA7A|nr:hypothetical protein [Pseudonocardia oroxyli]